MPRFGLWVLQIPLRIKSKGLLLNIQIEKCRGNEIMLWGDENFSIVALQFMFFCGKFKITMTVIIFYNDRWPRERGLDINNPLGFIERATIDNAMYRSKLSSPNSHTWGQVSTPPFFHTYQTTNSFALRNWKHVSTLFLSTLSSSVC